MKFRLSEKTYEAINEKADYVSEYNRYINQYDNDYDDVEEFFDRVKNNKIYNIRMKRGYSYEGAF